MRVQIILAPPKRCRAAREGGVSLDKGGRAATSRRRAQPLARMATSNIQRSPMPIGPIVHDLHEHINTDCCAFLNTLSTLLSAAAALGQR